MIEETVHQKIKLEEDISNLLLYVTIRGDVAANREFNDCCDAALEELDLKIKEELRKNGSDCRAINPALRSKVISNNYFLDIISGPEERILEAYLGHIVDQRVETFEGKEHLFLLCHSNQHGFLGAPYSQKTQEGDIAVYTNKGVTWIDSRKKADYQKVEAIEPMISKVDIGILFDMLEKGDKNYCKIIERLGHEKSA